MAGKLVELKEAATMLGMAPEDLSDLRSRGEIHGYRDGSSWKFKVEEIERVADELDIELARGSGIELPAAAELNDDMDDIFADEGDDSTDDADSILVSEEELGQSTGASTIIGKKSGESGEDSDIQISDPDDSEIGLAAAESDLQLSSGEGAPSGSGVGEKSSDVELDDAAVGSDLDLVAGDSGPVGDDLGKKTSTGDRESEAGSDLTVDAKDDLELAVDSSLSLGTGSDEEDEELGATDSEVELDVDQADALELGASGIDSDVTLGAADSGINLSPTDSGLSLENPLDLGGSSVEQLELPEDEDIISLDEEVGDPEAATQLKADDEFLLTPVEDTPEDESSGSQVIALEDSDVYADADAQTMLGANQLQPTEQPGAAPLVAEDADMLGAGATGIGGTGGVTAQPMPQQAVPTEQPEASYSIWNVLSLMLVLVVLVLTGMFMYDVVKNLSEFESSSTTTVSLVDSVIKAIGLDKQ